MNYCIRAFVHDGPSEPISMALVPVLTARINWLESIRTTTQANEAKREVEVASARTAHAHARVVELSEILLKVIAGDGDAPRVYHSISHGMIETHFNNAD